MYLQQGCVPAQLIGGNHTSAQRTCELHWHRQPRHKHGLTQTERTIISQCLSQSKFHRRGIKTYRVATHLPPLVYKEMAQDAQGMPSLHAPRQADRMAQLGMLRPGILLPKSKFWAKQQGMPAST